MSFIDQRIRHRRDTLVSRIVVIPLLGNPWFRRGSFSWRETVPGGLRRVGGIYSVLRSINK